MPDLVLHFSDNRHRNLTLEAEWRRIQEGNTFGPTVDDYVQWLIEQDGQSIRKEIQRRRA